MPNASSFHNLMKAQFQELKFLDFLVSENNHFIQEINIIKKVHQNMNLFSQGVKYCETRNINYDKY